ncbi:MAG: hypothetical protein V8T33_05285 [Parabacteroides distasonis]
MESETDSIDLAKDRISLVFRSCFLIPTNIGAGVRAQKAHLYVPI